MKVSEKLQIILQLSKQTQTELAADLNVSFPTLNSWINGRSQPRQKKIDSIDKIYRSLTGQKNIPNDVRSAKCALILQKSKQKSNWIEFIQSRVDLYEQLVLSFTYNTNSIEGSTLTENETAAILFEGLTIKNKDLVEHLEAKNHQRALGFLFKELELNYPITEEFILRLHEILMSNIREDAGNYRTHGVRIVGSNVVTSNHMSIELHMNELLAGINANEEDVIAHATRVHARFEQIHPFSDGNGRVGRLIMAAMLLRKNIAPAVIKKEKKMDYYKFLQAAQLKDEYEGLERFICDAILNGFDIIVPE